MNTFFNDIKYAFRQLRKSPGFTAVAVISLALGIGANTAIFSLVNAILLRSLPVPNPHELRVLKWSGNDAQINYFCGGMTSDAAKRSTGDAFTYPLFLNMRENSDALADIFGYTPLHNITIRARHEAFIATGTMVSDNFFSGLRVRPLLGRLIGPEDEQAGAMPSAVISYRLWQQQFDLDPAVLGQLLTLNSNSYTIVGVLPREFPGVRRADNISFYVSTSTQPQLQPSLPRISSDHWWVQTMARLKPKTSDTQFQAAIDVIFARETVSIMKYPKVLVEDGRAGPSYDRSYYRKPLLLLLGIVSVVLLVACANVAGLSLARGATRQHELAVRAAIGAGRWRLMRQSLTESMLISLLGAGVGILLAIWGKTMISHLLGGSQEGLHYDTSLDLTVLGFTLAIALITALLSGLLPSIRAAGANPYIAMKDRSTVGSPRLRMGKFLVSAQIALSMVLLAGAGLYVRTLVNLVHINPGFAVENLLLFQVTPSNAGYQGERMTEFYDSVQRSLAAIPGVRSVTLTQFSLLGDMMSGGGFFTVPGHSFEGELKPQAHRLTVSETFFETMGIPVRLGRGFIAADVDGAPKVVVVNETFAGKYLPGENPIGQTLSADNVDWQIAGVCRDAKYTDIKAEAPPTVYFSFRQDPIVSTFFALRTSLPPLAVVTAVRKVMATLDSNVPLSNISTQEQVRDKKISQERLFAFLCSTLALLAVLLACIGLYGLMAYNVEHRTNEIGIRIALGATNRNIAGPILREALLLTGIGVAVGVPTALAIGRVIKSQLYGVVPSDPLTLAGGALSLVIVAVVAAWIPAHRAAKVDPMVALRCE